MALRIRKNGDIVCAALNKEEDGDCYIDDGVHYYLSAIKKVLVTSKEPYHTLEKGRWWWKGQEPKRVKIDKYYYTK